LKTKTQNKNGQEYNVRKFHVKLDRLYKEKGDR